MTNEWKEFKAYTGKPVYRSSGKKDRTFLGRFTIEMMCEFTGFKRILTIIARGYLFHAKDGSLLPGDPRDRLEYALNALKAWCSVPDKSKSSVPPVDFRELSDDFPELVDKSGNGWYYRHAKKVMDYVKKNPGIVHSSIVKKCEEMRRGFTKEWQKEVRGLQVPIFALNTKAGWKLRFDDILADALEAGPLRMGEYELPQHVSDMLSILCPEDVPVDVLKDIAAFYLASRREDTDWVVLPVANFEAYYGTTNFSKLYLKKIPETILVRESQGYVCRVRMMIKTPKA